MSRYTMADGQLIKITYKVDDPNNSKELDQYVVAESFRKAMNIFYAHKNPDEVIVNKIEHVDIMVLCEDEVLERNTSSEY